MASASKSAPISKLTRALSSRSPAGAGNGGASNGDVPKAWTFLTNHAHVLILLQSDPRMVLREVALRVGITERAVQRIVQDLEEDGYLLRHKVGRQNEYQILSQQRLRHPVESHRKIADLLKLMSR